MKEQFTKAPWKYSHEPDTRMSSADQHEHKILATNDDCEFRVASVNVFDSEDIANAHLIAAAPKMYHMIESLKSELMWMITNENNRRKANSSITDLQPRDQLDAESVYLADKLLAEARGETT